ncbi:testis-expressed protein 2-like isoform X2 [Brachyhypopomus gauderio]|uniref:testis-expressed protein 2-like isoform X2 n=1 Tax=Brachyhypopomus gauderio TaxID=698409 RepID=UPI004041F746
MLASAPDTSTEPPSLAAPRGIVKSSSSSSDTESTSAAPLKPKQSLGLVRSLSAEISQREPEACLSQSDSELHLQTRERPPPPPRPRSEDEGPSASTGPSSRGEHQPSLDTSLRAELEDTRRKLSEAMHEPLSMLSKIMGEEGVGTRAQRGVMSRDLPVSQGGVLEGTLVRGEAGGVCQHPEEASCETSPQETRRGLPELCRELPADGGRYEIRTCTNVMRVVKVKGHASSELTEPQQDRAGACLEPGRWLACVGLLTYSFFVLPLSSYLAGLSLGLACGFMMGLGVMLMLAPRRLTTTRKPTPSHDDRPSADSTSRGQSGVLQGWMNETCAYDPETFHPSLCHPVYATLHSCCLRLAYPPASGPHRAIEGEPTHDATFTRTRCFRLTNSKVSLLPSALAKKRMWNKKYPICIVRAEEEECGEEDGCGEDVRSSKRAEEEAEDEEQPRRAQREGRGSATLYLFARTGREKEEWYQHLLLAVRAEPQGMLGHSGVRTEGSITEGSCLACPDDLSSMLAQRELAGSLRSSSEQGPRCRGGRPAWLNALIGRVFWDFLREHYWAEQVAHKIQNKLSRIRLPYFMNKLALAELDMGTCMPQVLSTSKPLVDHRGLWLELEVVYAGSLQMTLETKLKLCNLGRENVSETDSNAEPSRLAGSRVCVIEDSDEESSSAGSSDEEDPVPSESQGTLGNIPPHADGHGGGSRRRKILRFVDKITQSKYFQKATENEYIKRKIEEVSNTPLLLTVEVLELSGTLAVNVPPPPTDRIWYSFRVPPRLELRVRPMLGEREVTFTHVTQWIERKLQCEFQKVFVMPNMDDLYLPLMSSGVDSPDMSLHSLGEHQDGLLCQGSE